MFESSRAHQNNRKGTTMMWMHDALEVLLLLVFIKAITIGSEYNTVKRWKQGKEYTRKYSEWLKQAP